jgi:hypothetical protein
MRLLWLFFFTSVLAAQQPIGRTSASEVKVSGPVEISHGETVLGNGSEVSAGEQTVKVTLERGGALQVCSTSSIHLSRDRSVNDPSDSALMMALDRGAVEANYSVGKYSDVLLTPDLRILISGPGQAALSVRVNSKGDTCIDNHGAGAPYVVVSSQLDGGAYRVLPDQRVTFEHGSLHDVVDHEPEPCGCPTIPAVSVAGKSGGPSSIPADTAFPIAESEGLAAPPTPGPAPTVPAGQTHAEVSVPLTYNGENPAPPPAPAAKAQPPAVAIAPPPPAAETAPPTPPPAPKAPPPRGFFHRVGHFFSRIFG